MKKFIAWTLILACMFSLIGCGKKAEPKVLPLPSINEIDSITITTFDGSEVLYSDKEWIEQFIAVVTQAEYTTKETIQDVPNAEIYGKVDISYNDRITTIFYYTEDGKNYIEKPYQGIYVTDVDIDTWINE